MGTPYEPISKINMIPENFFKKRSFWIKFFGICGVAVFIYKTITFWLPFILAVVFSFVLYPLVNMIKKVPIGPNKIHLPNVLAIIVAFVLTLGFCVATAIFILVPLLAEFHNLLQNFPILAKHMQNVFAERSVSLPDNIKLLIEQGLTWSTEYLLSSLKLFASSLIVFVSDAVELVIVPVLTFYLLCDWREMKKSFLSILPTKSRIKTEVVFNELGVVMTAYVQGQVKLSMLAATVITMGVISMDLEYPLVLGLAAAFGEVIPLVGPIFSALPAIVLGYMISLDIAIKVTLFYLLYNQIDSHLIIPKIMGNSINLHPIVIISSLLIGGKIFGIMGMIFAVPITAILRVILKHLFFELEGELV